VHGKSHPSERPTIIQEFFIFNKVLPQISIFLFDSIAELVRFIEK